MTSGGEPGASPPPAAPPGPPPGACPFPPDDAFMARPKYEKYKNAKKQLLYQGGSWNH